uniref:Uncharacterized protein n=1 Tax=Crocodylus porosus TaxID=8502 RepID=A0A7M4FA77_CROPO
ACCRSPWSTTWPCSRRYQDLLAELTCPVCLELLAEPVLLECGHHFCRDCITQCWTPLTEGPFSCPQCRTVYLEPRLLKDQSCKEHREPISLFCLSHESPICHVCVGTPGHAGHSFSSLQDAMCSYKVSEQQHRMQPHSDRWVPHSTGGCSENALTTLQHRISSELADLRQFLAQREATLLRELQEAAEAVHWEMEAALGSVRERLQAKQVHRLKPEQKGAARAQPTVVCSLLKLAQFQGPIQYTIWKAMRSVLSPGNPASVTLDPHTAHPALVLSDDLMSVQLGAQRRLLPDNPERFRVYCLVLGQPALTGGCHYWEVEVGNKADWALGVACESLERKGKLASSAHEVCWVLRRNDRGQYLAVASCPQPLTVEAPPRTVGVYVDYERGCVSFYNTVGMEHLHTLSGAFNEPLRPIFYPGCDSVPLRLLHPTL